MDVKIHGFTEEQLMKMDQEPLRAILHERSHHTIEVLIYRILRGKLKKPPNLGKEAKTVLEIWRRRGFPTDPPDIRWCMKYVELAEKLNAGQKISIDAELPKPFSSSEMKTIEKLLYERRSIRQFKKKTVSDAVINKILFAGLMAPQGCNVGSTRFIVLRDSEEWKLVRSDIPLDNGVMIVICQDMRVYRVLRFDERVPHNIYFDSAATADHMCLMAHALGLGACWLTHGEETQKKLGEHFGLPEHIISRCHLIIGWPDEAPIKSQRMRVDEATIVRK